MFAATRRGLGAVRAPDGDGAVRAPEPGGGGARAGRGLDQPQARPPDALRQPVPPDHLQSVSSIYKVTEKWQVFILIIK